MVQHLDGPAVRAQDPVAGLLGGANRLAGRKARVRLAMGQIAEGPSRVRTAAHREGPRQHRLRELRLQGPAGRHLGRDHPRHVPFKRRLVDDDEAAAFGVEAHAPRITALLGVDAQAYAPLRPLAEDERLVREGSAVDPKAVAHGLDDGRASSPGTVRC
ncbi:hypothetical protein D3C86_1256390 [compost metagenome]